MKKTLHLIICFFVSFSVFSQEDAWVYFNTKPNATFYYNTPLEMLSQRALDRRTNQNIVIDFKDIPIEPSYITQIKAATGIVVMAKSKWLNALHIRGNQAAIEALKLLSFVEKVDFANKMLNQAGKKTIVNKVKKANKKLETQVNYAYGNSANQILMLNGQTMHQQNYTGSGKIIAVMDAGFPGVNVALPFQRLRDNNQILGGYDYVLRNPDFYTGNSHGTSVLSTMGGYKENFLVGTAPDASYYLFITEDDTTENPVEESLWVEAAEKADSLGVDVINTSLGYSNEHTNSAYDYTYSDMNGATTFISKGAEIAFSRGMIIVASAGNSGGSSNPYIAAPADAISIIAVGAVNTSKNLASYSSIGPSFDGRVKPDLMAQGSATVLSNESGDIVTSSGTSFSCPIMTGMIACLWQAFPEKTNQEIKQLLFESADKFATPNDQFGYGIPDFSVAITNGLALHQFEENNFKIYPNPTNDTLFLSFPKDFNQGTIFIYTIFGQKVLEQKISNQVTTLSLKTLNQGMYVYKLESNGYFKTGKIIKH
jgi:subtilisin family serine protease